MPSFWAPGPLSLRMVLRWATYCLLALFVALLLLYVGLALYNLNDEPIDPALAAALAESPPQIDPERNGYFAWVGVMGPESVPVHAWGRRWYEAALIADARFCDKDTQPKLALDRELRKDPWPADGLCAQAETCLDEVAADPERARSLLADARTTLERADTAMAYPEYQEAWRSDICLSSAMPQYPKVWSQASSARFALDVAEGRHTAALARLAREMRFHVTHLAGSVTHLDKVVGTIYVRNDYFLLASYLRRHPDSARAHGESMASMLAPLPEAARSIRMPVQSETTALAKLLLGLRPTELHGNSGSLGGSPESRRDWRLDWLWRFLYQAHATANEFYRSYSRLIDSDTLSDADYRAALIVVNADANDHRMSLLDHLDPRNPIGRRLLSNMSDYSSFFFRRDDMVVLRAVLARRYSQLAQGKAASEMADLVADTEFIHRSTGEGPQWDSAAQALVYPPHKSRRNNDAMTIPL